MKYHNTSHYAKILHEKYPDIPLCDIRTCLNFGWRTYLSYILRGCDINIKTPKSVSLCGQLYTNPLLYVRNYRNKLVRKLRVLFLTRSIEWDGYYYFALNDTEFQKQYLSVVKNDEPIQKNITFSDVRLFMLKDECIISRWASMHLFRVPYVGTFGYKLFLPIYTPFEVEYMGNIPKKSLHDLLISTYNYDTINGTNAKYLRKRIIPGQ